MRQYVIDAFTDHVFAGNPAAVCVMDRWLDEAKMMAITIENNLSETAFAVREGEKYHLRWFTPGGEIDLCLVTQLAGRHNLASLQTLGISSIHYHLLSPDTVVLFHEFHLVNNLLFQEAGITWLVDFHLAHHLTNDDFKVLIINLHTLQTVNVLNLVHNIFLHGRRTFDSQDVRRCDSTVRQRSTGTSADLF